MEQKAYLVLEDGRVFEGRRFGAEQDALGEIVFTTAMTGYLETLTDPSYYGQIVVQTFPLIGNYGVIPPDFESKRPHLTAYVVREWCRVPSNFRCEGDLDAYLKKEGIPGIYGVDTRELTKIIRERGVMNASISSSPNIDMDKLKTFSIQNAVASVSLPEPAPVKPEKCRYKVVLWDFGAKANIARELLKRGCEVITVPSNATAEEILALKPDGLMLSNGPGDPAENVLIIKELAKVCSSKFPIFGICLGHQLLALSQGAKTMKLHYGHRGANQPVKEIQTGRVYLSSQNHGYAVDSDTLPANAKLIYSNANDDTCEGLSYSNMPAFSVQFHPEASAGPLDTGFLFDQFMKKMEENENAAR